MRPGRGIHSGFLVFGVEPSITRVTLTVARKASAPQTREAGCLPPTPQGTERSSARHAVLSDFLEPSLIRKAEQQAHIKDSLPPAGRAGRKQGAHTPQRTGSAPPPAGRGHNPWVGGGGVSKKAGEAVGRPREGSVREALVRGPCGGRAAMAHPGI